MSFSLTPDKALAARADYEMATILLTWAQEARQAALRGEITAPKRLRLLEAVGAALDHPRHG